MEILIPLGGLIIFLWGLIIILDGQERRRLARLASDHQWTLLDQQPARSGALVTRQIRGGLRAEQWIYALCEATLNDAINRGDVALLMRGPRAANTVWSTSHGGTAHPVLCVPLTADGRDPFDRGDLQHNIRARLLADVLIGAAPARSYDLARIEDATLDAPLDQYALYSTDADTAHTVSARIAAPLAEFLSATAQPQANRPVILLHADGVVVALKEPVTVPTEVHHIIALGTQIAGLKPPAAL